MTSSLCVLVSRCPSSYKDASQTGCHANSRPVGAHPHLLTSAKTPLPQTVTRTGTGGWSTSLSLAWKGTQVTAALYGHLFIESQSTRGRLVTLGPPLHRQEAEAWGSRSPACQWQSKSQSWSFPSACSPHHPLQALLGTLSGSSGSETRTLVLQDDP